MLKSKEEYGLVLGGGGMKGTYQIGVWKAIEELGVNITAITGTSMGAINGALILQTDIKKIESLYKNLELTDILKFDSEMDENKDIFDVKNIFKLIKEYIKQNGIDNERLKETLVKYIDVEKVYKSKINFGLVTYSVNDSEKLELFKKDIPKEQFIDYLLASSCFPIFKAQEIEDDKFLDGGFGDNIPINMLIEEGYKNIIAVDVDIVGVKKKVLDKNAQVKLISPTEDVGGWFEFNKKTIENNITLGYLDTLKAFNKLQGYIYSFRESEYAKLLKQFNIKTIIGLEKVAEIYEIDKYKIYSAKEFLEVIAKEQEVRNDKYKNIMSDIDLEKISTKYKELKEMVKKGFGICLFNDIIKQNPTAKSNKILQKAFPDYLIITQAVSELMNQKGVK